MPPDASSRSRTYLPKIWGNKRLSHATAVLALLLAGGCRTVPGPLRDHPIRAHFLPGCTPEKTTPFRLDLSALGDFDPTGETFESFDDPRVSNRPLVVPGSTAAVTLDATAGTTALLGLGTRDADGAIDVALFPASDSCTLADGASGYPKATADAGEALGVTRDGRHLLVTGSNGAASALSIDLATGKTEDVKDGLRAARVSPVITPFGDGLLVSGGLAPDTREVLGSADVYDAGARRFDPTRIELERPRASHGATVLASGETLLAGGVDAGGRGIRRLEAVSPSSRTYRIAGLAELAFGRVSPTVLTLSDGRVLVAGGTDPEHPGTPVDTLEWLTADAANPDGTLSLDPPTQHRAFAAMPGGSVLVAGGCVGAGDACTPSSQVLWITRDGVSAELPSLDAPTNAPVLIAGSEGRPLLVADGLGGTKTLRVFDPFTGRFTEDDSLPDAPSPVAAVFAAADRGLFTWLDVDADRRGVVRAARHGLRNEYSPDVSTLLSEDLSGVSLDRAPQSNYDAAAHAVHLDGGARLVLTDTTYADFHLAVTVMGSAVPVVRLGERVFGDRACPFPEGTSNEVSVDRTGTTVTLGREQKRANCAGPDGRVSVSLEGGGGLPTVTRVEIRRSAE